MQTLQLQVSKEQCISFEVNFFALNLLYKWPELNICDIQKRKGGYSFCAIARSVVFHPILVRLLEFKA